MLLQQQPSTGYQHATRSTRNSALPGPDAPPSVFALAQHAGHFDDLQDADSDCRATIADPAAPYPSVAQQPSGDRCGVECLESLLPADLTFAIDHEEPCKALRPSYKPTALPLQMLQPSASAVHIPVRNPWSYDPDTEAAVAAAARHGPPPPPPPYGGTPRGRSLGTAQAQVRPRTPLTHTPYLPSPSLHGPHPAAPPCHWAFPSHEPRSPNPRAHVTCPPAALPLAPQAAGAHAPSHARPQLPPDSPLLAMSRSVPDAAATFAAGLLPPPPPPPGRPNAPRASLPPGPPPPLSPSCAVRLLSEGSPSASPHRSPAHLRACAEPFSLSGTPPPPPPRDAGLSKLSGDGSLRSAVSLRNHVRRNSAGSAAAAGGTPPPPPPPRDGVAPPLPPLDLSSLSSAPGADGAAIVTQSSRSVASLLQEALGGGSPAAGGPDGWPGAGAALLPPPPLHSKSSTPRSLAPPPPPPPRGTADASRLRSLSSGSAMPIPGLSPPRADGAADALPPPPSGPLVLPSLAEAQALVTAALTDTSDHSLVAALQLASHLQTLAAMRVASAAAGAAPPPPPPPRPAPLSPLDSMASAARLASMGSASFARTPSGIPPALASRSSAALGAHAQLPPPPAGGPFGAAPPPPPPPPRQLSVGSGSGVIAASRLNSPGSVNLPPMPFAGAGAPPPPPPPPPPRALQPVPSSPMAEGGSPYARTSPFACCQRSGEQPPRPPPREHLPPTRQANPSLPAWPDCNRRHPPRPPHAPLATLRSSPRPAPRP
jgi:hypothetical protein